MNILELAKQFVLKCALKFTSVWIQYLYLEKNINILRIFEKQLFSASRCTSELIFSKKVSGKHAPIYLH